MIISLNNKTRLSACLNKEAFFYIERGKQPFFYIALLLMAVILFGYASYANAANSAHNAYQNRCFTVTGTASLDNMSEAFARQMAIRNGLKLASMHSNLSISSEQVVTDFALAKDATRFTSHSKVSQFSILQEGMQMPNDALPNFDENGNEIKPEKTNVYEVQLKVCLTEDPQACDTALGNHLQPKLAIAQIVTTDSYGARDISNFVPGYQLELNRRLQQKGYRNQLMIENGMDILPNATVAPNLSPEVLAPIRDKTGAQYLLLTVFRSLASQNESPSMLNDIKRFYDREVKPNARYLELDSYIVDLNSYTIASQKRHGFNVKGDVTIGRDRPFGTSAFFATDAGTAFHALLETQTRTVMNELKCKSVETQVIDIRGDDYVLFLSAASGARVGDELVVYHKFGAPVRFQGADLGTDSEPTGFLKIKRIQSRFAVAELIAKEGLIQVGDTVRTW